MRLVCGAVLFSLTLALTFFGAFSFLIEYALPPLFSSVPRPLPFPFPFHSFPFISFSFLLGFLNLVFAQEFFQGLLFKEVNTFIYIILFMFKTNLTESRRHQKLPSHNSWAPLCFGIQILGDFRKVRSFYNSKLRIMPHSQWCLGSLPCAKILIFL